MSEHPVIVMVFFTPSPFVDTFTKYKLLIKEDNLSNPLLTCQRSLYTPLIERKSYMSKSSPILLYKSLYLYVFEYVFYIGQFFITYFSMIILCHIQFRDTSP